MVDPSYFDKQYFDTLSPEDKQKALEEMTVEFLSSWIGLLEINQQELADYLSVNRVYLSKVINKKYPFADKLKTNAINSISYITDRRMFERDEKSRAATNVVKFYLSKLSTDIKFNPDVVNAFFKNATVKDLKCLDKEITALIKEMNSEEEAEGKLPYSRLNKL